MSSVLNILGIQNDSLNLCFVIPVAAVLVAVNILFKFGTRKSTTTKQSNNAKKQKVTTRQKEEKSSEKKGKERTKHEKKTLPTSAKDVEVPSDKLKPKPSKKHVANDMLPKRTSPSKKQQVLVKSTANPSNKVKTEKLSNSLIDKKEDGEWQMVVKKKQKQTKPEEIVVPSKTKKSPEKTSKNINKKKTNIIEKEEVKHLAKVDLIPLTPPHQNQEAASNFKDNSQPVHYDVSHNEAHTESSEDNTLRVKNIQTTNVAFDELAGDGWTNTKPHKKKALRE